LLHPETRSVFLGQVPKVPKALALDYLRSQALKKYCKRVIGGSFRFAHVQQIQLLCFTFIGK
jgi:hypothetical protein